MRPHDDPAALTADERLREVAAILAAGVLRLRSRNALLADPLTLHPLPKGEGRGEGAPKNLPESVQDCLEIPAETVLSVHTG
ncbi:MAG: hypothetical protein KatS3mg105_2241 [Gemmatales bacterium]|nr:MAG: hypothetical protein KatS3mg105_2241 [Gemmatales bacterium]